MATEQKEATHKLEEVEVYKVDLVGKPATGDKFLVVRSEGGRKMPRAAMSPEQYKARYESLPESVSVADVTQPKEVERRAPPADVTKLKAGADPNYNPDDPMDRLLPAEVKEKPQGQVQRTEEDTMSTKLDDAVDRFGALIERMEGIFANPAQKQQGGPTEETKKEEGEMKAEETTPEAKVEATKEKAAEAPQEAPKVVAAAPVAEPTSVVAELTAAPVTASFAPMVSGESNLATFDPSVIATGMEKMGAVVERFAQSMEKVQETLGGLTDRLGKVERSVKTGNAEPQDETEPVERGEGEKSFWGGLVTG